MGMMIDEAMNNLSEILKEATESEDSVCYVTENDAETLQVAIDTMRKYQKIKPRKGHWIEHDCKSLREMGYYRCSECNCGYQRYERGVRKSEVPYINGQKYELHRIDNFCPNCGAKMVEPQESEDKE